MPMKKRRRDEQRRTLAAKQEDTMKRLLFGLIAASIAWSAFAERRVIVLAGHLPGDKGTLWKTDLTLANPSSQGQDVTIVFHPGGSEWKKTVTLGPGESTLLEDALDPASFGDGAPAAWIGELELVSPFRIDASARIFTGSNETGGTYGTTYESFDVGGLPARGLLTGLLSNDRFRSNVAFANASDVTTVVHFDVRRGDGTRASGANLSLPPHASMQRSMGEFVPDAGDDPLSVEWSSSGPAMAVGAIMDQKSGDPTNSPSVDDAHRSLLFPSVGKFPGNGGTFWNTSLALTSDGDADDDVELELHLGDGSSAHASVTIPPRGSFRSDDLFALFGLPGGSGVLELAASQPTVALARMFNTRDDGSTSGLSVLPQNLDDGSLHTRIAGVRRDSRFRLNVSITNSGASGASGSIRLEDGAGHEVETRSFSVASMSTAQFSLTQTSVEVESGQIDVEVEHGSAVTALAAMVDNDSGDSSVQPGEDAHQREQEIDFAFSPAAPAVGEAVQFTASAGSPGAAFAWDFGDGASTDGATASHAFASAGEHLVTLTVTLAGGAVVHKAEDVHVGGVGAAGGSAGIDFIWSPAAFSPGQPVTFTAIFSSAPAAGAVVKWSFPGGVHATGNPAIFTFVSSEPETVEAELEQEGQLTLSASHVVIPGGGSATGGGGGDFATAVDFTWNPTSIVVGQPVTFTATFTGTPAAGFVVTWSFPGGVHATGNPAVFTFTKAEAESVEVELEQNGHATLSAIHPVAPGGGGGGGTGSGATAVDFTWSPSAVVVGSPVTFTATFTGTPLAGATITWSFPGGVHATGNGVAFTFTKAESELVEVELDQPGQPALFATHTITPGGGSGGGGDVATGVDFSWSPLLPAVGETVTFTATFTGTPSAGAIVRWSFPHGVKATGNPGTFMFDSADTESITVELEQAGQVTLSATHSVTIH